jgi:hypothetical protein
MLADASSVRLSERDGYTWVRLSKRDGYGMA